VFNLAKFIVSSHNTELRILVPLKITIDIMQLEKL